MSKKKHSARESLIFQAMIELEKYRGLGERKKIQGFIQNIKNLHCEISCRIGHGARSNGHLEFVEYKLKKILKDL